MQKQNHYGNGGDERSSGKIEGRRAHRARVRETKHGGEARGELQFVVERSPRTDKRVSYVAFMKKRGGGCLFSFYGGASR